MNQDYCIDNIIQCNCCMKENIKSSYTYDECDRQLCN